MEKNCKIPAGGESALSRSRAQSGAAGAQHVDAVTQHAGDETRRVGAAAGPSCP